MDSIIFLQFLLSLHSRFKFQGEKLLHMRHDKTLSKRCIGFQGPQSFLWECSVIADTTAAQDEVIFANPMRNAIPMLCSPGVSPNPQMF